MMVSDKTLLTLIIDQYNVPGIDFFRFNNINIYYNDLFMSVCLCVLVNRQPAMCQRLQTQCM